MENSKSIYDGFLFQPFLCQCFLYDLDSLALIMYEGQEGLLIKSNAQESWPLH